MKIKFLRFQILKGKIRVKTGLRIGGSAEGIEIGGMENPVIRNPITKEPYIPGSSLKGKLRSLLEWRLDRIDPSGDVHKCKDPNCPICRIFGSSAEEASLGPTRLIIRDAELTQGYKDKMHKRGDILIEEKYENSINRIDASAIPRPIERVSSGVVFDFEMSYKVFDVDDDKGKTDESNFNHVLASLHYIEQDGLGGCISRGCGQVEFRVRNESDQWCKVQITNGKANLLKDPEFKDEEWS